MKTVTDEAQEAAAKTERNFGGSCSRSLQPKRPMPVSISARCW